MNDRCACLVPGCRRTTKPGPGEWICQRHWQAIPKDRRRVLRRIRREYRRRFGNAGFWEFPLGSEQRMAAHQLEIRWRRVWRCLKRVATIAAFTEPMV